MTMTAIDTEQVLALMREVGAGLCETFWHADPVVEPDEMIEAFRRVDGAASAGLRQALAQRYPAIGWIDNDIGEVTGDGEYWLCDAVDGAIQFVRAIPGWAMSLTLMREGVPVFTAVFDAMHDEMFHALSGHGAYNNGKAIRVNQRDSHYNAVVAGSQPPFVGKRRVPTRQAGAALSIMLRDVVAVRNLGATSLQLAYVACGRLDAFWEYGEGGFNCIGAALLILEAGGVVTQADGAPYSVGATSIAAAPPGAHASMLLRLQQVPLA
jgi:myo-inositol-1(or 4)-monophosphatase